MDKKTNSILIGIGILVVVAIVSFIELRGEDVIPAGPNTAQTNLNKDDVSYSKADYYDTHDGAVEAIRGKTMTDLQKLNGKTIEIAFEQYYFDGRIDIEKKGRNIVMEFVFKDNPVVSLDGWAIEFDNIDFENDKKAAELHNLAKEYKSILISARGKCFVDHRTEFKNNKHTDTYCIFLTNAKITNIFSYGKKDCHEIFNKNNKIAYPDYIMNIPQEKYLRNAF